MKVSKRLLALCVFACLALTACGKQQGASTTNTTASSTAAPAAITLGYSDWPGWTCWDIAQQEGFFKKHNVNVQLKWFGTYTDSLNAFQSGAVNANCQTWSDTIPMLAASPPVAATAVLINDNSAGNDAVIAGPNVTSIKQLKGLRIATELGTVEQFLLDEALAANGMTEKDIHYVNIKVQDCPAAMISHQIDACAVWEPNKSQLLKAMPGPHVIFDSRSLPGMIPDLLVFQKSVVAAQPQQVQGIVDAWYDTMAWWRAHPQQAVTIMAAQTQSPASQYDNFIKGTRIFDAAEAKAAFTKSSKPTSLYTSGAAITQFLITQKQITTAPDFASALDDQFVDAAVQSGEGKQPPYAYTLKVD